MRQLGASAEEEALRRIGEVVEMVVGELVRDGESLPEEPAEEVEVFAEPRVLPREARFRF